MVNLSDIASNPEAEVGGVWVNTEADVFVRVSRMWNAEFEDLYARLTQQAIEAHGAQLPDEVKEGIILEATSATIVRDWVMVDGEIDDRLNPIEVEPKVMDLNQEELGASRQVRVAVAGKPEFTVHEFEAGGTWFRKLEADDQIEIPDGWTFAQQIIRYSPDLGRRMFADPRYRDIYSTIRAVSLQSNRYRESAIQATVGN